MARLFVSSRSSEQQLPIPDHIYTPRRFPSRSGEGGAKCYNVQHVLSVTGWTPGGGFQCPLVSSLCVASSLRRFRVDRGRHSSSRRGGRRLVRTSLPRLGVVTISAGPTGPAHSTGPSPSGRGNSERGTTRGSGRGCRPTRSRGRHGGGEEPDPSSTPQPALAGGLSPGPLSSGAGAAYQQISRNRPLRSLPGVRSHHFAV